MSYIYIYITWISPIRINNFDLIPASCSYKIELPLITQRVFFKFTHINLEL